VEKTSKRVPGEAEKTRVRWYNPATWVVRATEETYAFGARTVVDTYDAVTAYPLAVVREVKEARARLQVASDYERKITRLTTGWWFGVGATAVVLFRALPNMFTALVVILVGVAFFFRGKRDFVREQVMAFIPAESGGQTVGPMTLELAAIRLESVEHIISAWKGLPRTERLGSSATVLMRCLDALSRDLSEESPAGEQVVPQADEPSPVVASDRAEAGLPKDDSTQENS
jgi:hypothetical protein